MTAHACAWAIALCGAFAAGGIRRVEAAAWPLSSRWFRTSATVNALALDGRGRLIVATLEGLYRFDGERFDRVAEVGSLPHLVVPLRDGGLLIAEGTGLAPGAPTSARAGIGLLQQATQTFTWIRDGGVTRMTLDQRSTLLVHSALDDDDGTVLLATSTGVHAIGADGVIDPAWARPLAGTTVRAIARGDAETLWLGTDDGLIARARGGLQPRVAGIAGPVRALAQTGDGTLVVAAADAIVRLVVRDGTMATTEIARRPGGFHALSVGPDDAVWAAADDGVHRSDDAGTRRLGTGDGVPDAGVLTLLADARGGVWLGTRGAGLVGLVAPWVRDVATVDKPRAVLASGSRMLAATTGGLVVVDGARAAPAPGWQPRWGGARAMVAAADGAIYVASDAGVVRWSPDGTARLARTGSPHALAITSSGGEDTLWAATGGSLVRGALRARDWEPARVDLPALGACAGRINALTVDAMGVLTLATDGGVARVRGGRATCLVPADRPTAVHRVGALVIDEHETVWAGSRAGLLRVRDDGMDLFDERDGLPCDSIRHLLADGQGHLWIACMGGVARVPLRALERSAIDRRARIEAIVFSRRDGMLSEEAVVDHAPGLARDADGNVWVATLLGLVAIRDPEQRSTALPRPMVTRVRFDGHSASFEADVETPVLDFPERLLLRHRLVGRDDRFSIPVVAGLRTSMRFDGLAPGDYELQIAAGLGLGQWSATTTHRLHVPPPWHRATGFLAGLALAIGVIGFAVHRLRLRNARARFAAIASERARIARDLHDSVAQGLTAMAFFLEAIERGSTGSSDANVAGARGAVHAMRVSVRSAVWDLRRDDGDPATLGEAFERLRRSCTPPGGVPAIEVVVDPALCVSAQSLHELPAIASEAVTNAVRHASAKRVLVWARREQAAVVLSIEDDGQGLPQTLPDGASGHFGLLGMRERARRIGATITFGAAAAGGASVELRLPASRTCHLGGSP